MARATENPLLALRKNAEKKYGSPVGTLSDIGSDARFFSSGNIAIDYAIGGGIPMGRSIEAYGPTSSGKTTLALQAVAQMQKIIMNGGDPALGIAADDAILYTDFEQTVDIKYARALGVDVSHESLQFSQPDYLEDGAQMILDYVRSDKVRLVIVDSVAGMNPRAVAENDVGKSLPAIAAKILTPWGTTLNTELANHNCTIIFINHEKVGMGMGRPGAPAPVTTPGGAALKYFASIRLRFQQVRNHKGFIVDKITGQKIEVPVMTDTKVTVTKNKVAPPMRQALIRVRFGRGFDNFWTALMALIAHKQIVVETGGRYFFHKAEPLIEDWMTMSAPKAQTPARPYIHGEAKVFEMADKNPEWRERVILMAQEVIASIDDDDMDAAVAEVEEDDDDDLDVGEPTTGNIAD